MDNKTIGLYALGAVAGGLLTWNIVTEGQKSDLKNKVEQIQASAFTQDSTRVVAFNDLVVKHKGLIDKYNCVHGSNGQLMRTNNNIRLSYDALSKEHKLLTFYADSINGELGKRDSLLTLANSRNDSLDLIINDITKTNMALSSDILNNRFELNQYKLAFEDSISNMQESIYGLLARPRFGISPRLDRNNVPSSVRFIPTSKQDVRTYRRVLNKQKYE